MCALCIHGQTCTMIYFTPVPSPVGTRCLAVLPCVYGLWWCSSGSEIKSRFLSTTHKVFYDRLPLPSQAWLSLASSKLTFSRLAAEASAPSPLHTQSLEVPRCRRTLSPLWLPLLHWDLSLSSFQREDTFFALDHVVDGIMTGENVFKMYKK